MTGKRGPSRSIKIIIAALDEESGIGPTITELREKLGNPQILVVDGKSSDKTAKIARKMDVEVICQDDTGKGDALARGIRIIDPSIEYIVFTDADFTYPAEYVPRMIKILQRNAKAGMVCGNRFNQQLEKKIFRGLFHFGNRFLSFTHNLLNGIALQDPLTGLRVLRAEVLRDWQPKSKGFDIEVELNHHVERRGFTIIEVPIKYRTRLGEKKLKIKDGITIMRRMVLEKIDYVNAKIQLLHSIFPRNIYQELPTKKAIIDS